MHIHPADGRRFLGTFVRFHHSPSCARHSWEDLLHASSGVADAYSLAAEILGGLSFEAAFDQ